MGSISKTKNRGIFPSHYLTMIQLSNLGRRWEEEMALVTKLLPLWLSLSTRIGFIHELIIVESGRLW